MAKCTVCDQRKGKRRCRKKESMICSLCCGEIRSHDDCEGCSFWSPPKRNYGDIPYYSTVDMQSMENENISHVIESAFYAADNNKVLNDSNALAIVERLLDDYHFHSTGKTSMDEVEHQLYLDVQGKLNDIFSTENSEKIVKVLGAVRRSILRHSHGSRGYMDFIGNFIG